MSAIASIRLLVASAGNEFMLDIARVFEEGFASNGVACSIDLDGVPSTAPAPEGHVDLVVAPHEYFPLWLEARSPAVDLGATLDRLFVLNVEQPGSEWFDRAFTYAARARGVLDISASGVREFERRGVPALHAPLGYASHMRAPDVPDEAARPIDVLFLGHASPRRERFLARHADLFSRYRCCFVLTDVGRPRQAVTPGYYSGRERSRLLAQARILLNVHSSERPYFETHRALLGIANECLVVSEKSQFTEPLESDRHFVMGPLDEVPALVDYYVRNANERQAIVRRAHDFVVRSYSASALCGQALKCLEQTLVREGRSAASRRGRAPSRGDAADRAAALERLETSEARRAAGEPLWDTTTNQPYRESLSPSVTIAVTLYNYAHFIGECLASVARTDTSGLPGGFELVVVDDASTDGSVGEVDAFMQKASFPVLLARKRLNTGLADARNVGLELARAPYVFVLDADNWIYPSCASLLFAALESGGHAAAYGLISRVDDVTGERTGLHSLFVWSVPELVRGPYIDAMAMVKRDIVRALGGYATELIRYGWFGWEDYDLWLKLAQAGHTAKLVPQIVGCYREHPGSMVHLTNATSQGIAQYFHEKFAALVRRYPDLDGYFGYPMHARADPRARVVSLERELREMRTHVANVEKERFESRAHAANLEHELGELRAHATNLEQEQSGTRAHAANLERELEGIRAHAANLEREQSGTRAHAANLEHEMSGLRTHATNLEGERNALRSRVADLETERQELGSHVANLETDQAESRAHTVRLEQRAKTLAEDLFAAQRGLAEARAELGAVRSSASWRITAPLRALFSLLQRSRP